MRPQQRLSTDATSMKLLNSVPPLSTKDRDDLPTGDRVQEHSLWGKTEP